MFNFDDLNDWYLERRRDFVARFYQLWGRVFPEKKVVKQNPSAMTAEEALLVPLRESRVPEGTRVYAIGDIHGRADLLKKLMEKIREDVAKSNDPETRNAVVFLGDYIDRGFQSRQVIDLLVGDEYKEFDLRFLKGNHEETFQEFLMNSGIGQRWSQYGGIETLVSYNVQPPRGRDNFDGWEQARLDLVEKIPLSHRSFLETLEVCLVLGDYVFVHAGLRPGRSLEEQSEKDLMWIRDDFLYHKDAFEKVVVHGHTPINEPHRDFRRISVDTGAYMSSKLTAVRLFEDQVDFITT
ncbi:metallophosphoesterase family protein [Hirschia maritima]|uniref:metallophosphoesterase family protein n=1 Tax=Hirschia maritima TaxID=1121961 RepID=UPI00036C3CC4|nr:metallophosphoesterase family protein [Hirschia maritima]